MTRDTTVNIGTVRRAQQGLDSVQNYPPLMEYPPPRQHRQPGIAGMPFVYDDKDQLHGVDQVLLDRFAPGTAAHGPRGVSDQEGIEQVFADHRAALYDTASVQPFDEDFRGGRRHTTVLRGGNDNDLGSGRPTHVVHPRGTSVFVTAQGGMETIYTDPVPSPLHRAPGKSKKGRHSLAPTADMTKLNRPRQVDAQYDEVVKPAFVFPGSAAVGSVHPGSHMIGSSSVPSVLDGAGGTPARPHLPAISSP
jgi:hypothetical protein